MYSDINFKTKKALKTAIAEGKEIGIYQPGPFGGNELRNGEVSLEGPHFPAAHTWYARVRVAEGKIVKVIG